MEIFLAISVVVLAASLCASVGFAFRAKAAAEAAGENPETAEAEDKPKKTTKKSAAKKTAAKKTTKKTTTKKTTAKKTTKKTTKKAEDGEQAPKKRVTRKKKTEATEEPVDA